MLILGYISYLLRYNFKNNTFFFKGESNLQIFNTLRSWILTPSQVWKVLTRVLLLARFQQMG